MPGHSVPKGPLRARRLFRAKTLIYKLGSVAVRSKASFLGLIKSDDPGSIPEAADFSSPNFPVILQSSRRPKNLVNRQNEVWGSNQEQESVCGAWWMLRYSPYRCWLLAEEKSERISIVGYGVNL